MVLFDNILCNTIYTPGYVDHIYWNCLIINKFIMASGLYLFTDVHRISDVQSENFKLYFNLLVEYIFRAIYTDVGVHYSC